MHIRSRSLTHIALAAFLTAPGLFAQRAGLVDSFAPVVKKAQPAVVNISTTVVRQTRGGAPDIFDFFYGRGGQRPPRQQRGHSLGSGVIVRQDGYLLTNNHVVDGATDIKVALGDRREFKAKLIGTDPQTDVALLKIEAQDLPTVPFGDSSKAEVGDVVLALGNPFGIGQTVTMGIIGATGRSGLDIEQYEDFIQTDAAINPGNSGGALINTRGELIGINTAILAGEGGGNQGIGFAIPVNMARGVMDQLLKGGKVVRGYMGVGIQNVTPELAKGLGLQQSSGVAITQVESGGPAAKAGLKAGDVVTAVDGKPIYTDNELRLRISSTEPGKTVSLKVVREDGSSKDIPVTLAQLPSRDREQGAEQPAPGGESGGAALQGVSVQDLTPRIARQLGLATGVKGVIVTDVDPGSAAADSGLRRGDVIQHVNRKPVESVAEFNSLVRQSGSQSVLLLVNRQGQTAFIVIGK
jgi:serine protease Do